MQDTARSQRKTTTEEFLVWAEAQPKEAGRFELWDGRIIEKHGAAGTKNAERSQHWEMKAALYRALFSAAKESGIEAHVAIDGPGVPLSDNTTPEPDVLVYLGPKVPRDSLVVPEPVIVCEILSPANAQHDLSAKLEGYFSLASVQHYIIGDPDAPRIIHHQRDVGGRRITRCISDPSMPLDLVPPGFSIDLADVLERGDRA